MYDIRTNAIWALAAVAAIGTSGYALSGWTGGDEVLRSTSSKGSSSFSLGDAIASMRPSVDLVEEAAEPADVGVIGKYVRKSWADDILRKALLQTAVAQTTSGPLPAASGLGWGNVANNIIQSTPVASTAGATQSGSGNAGRSSLAIASASSIGSIPIPAFGGQLSGLGALSAVPALGLPALTDPLVVTGLTGPADPTATGTGTSSTSAAIASVPLPAGALLLGTALFGLGAMRRRKG